MTKDDRLGHSYRAGKLLFPGLASDFAAMIRAALALYEATGERGYLEQALNWQRALRRALRRPRHRRLLSGAPTTPTICCCGRIRPPDDATPNPNAVAAQNLVRLAVLSGDDQWRDKADRLIEGILSAAERNLFGHVALLNALDLRLRGAEIVVTGKDADALRAAAALKLPFTRPHRAARRVRRRSAGRRIRRRTK